MFERLFGSTEEEQMGYIQLKLFITVVVLIIGSIVTEGTAAIALASYVWAWTFLRNWLGFTTFGAIFSGNVVVGVLILVAYLLIGYVIGLIVFVLGLGRYIQLLITRRTH